jgi:rhomboid protease GluP
MKHITSFDEFVLRFRVLFVPFLIKSVVFIVAYSFLYRQLGLCKGLDTILVFFVAIVFSMLFCGLFAYFVLWKKMAEQLRIADKWLSKYSVSYFLIAFLTLLISTVSTQVYLIMAAAKLTKIETSAQIDISHPQHSLQIDHIFLDKSNVGISWLKDVDNSSPFSTGHHTILNGYFILPLMSSPSDSTKNIQHIWYAKRYNEFVRESLDEAEQDSVLKKFSEESVRDFNTEELSQITYFRRITSGRHYKEFVKAISKTRYSVNPDSLVILRPRYKSFQSETRFSLFLLCFSFGIGAFIILLMVLFKPLDEENKEYLRTGVIPVYAGQKVRECTGMKFRMSLKWLKLLLPRKGFFATPAIISLNVAIFIAMVSSVSSFFSFEIVELVKWGGNVPQLVAQGEFWRLFTGTFLHLGFSHLLANMSGLLLTGFFVERLLGTKRFVIAYVISGIVASIVSMPFHVATVSVGASGSIFGLFGVIIALLFTDLFPKSLRRPFLLGCILFVSAYLFIGLGANINNAAHIGGLICGLTIGFVYYRGLKEERTKCAKKVSPDDEKSPLEVSESDIENSN